MVQAEVVLSVDAYPVVVPVGRGRVDDVSADNLAAAAVTPSGFERTLSDHKGHGDSLKVLIKYSKLNPGDVITRHRRWLPASRMNEFSMPL